MGGGASADGHPKVASKAIASKAWEDAKRNAMVAAEAPSNVAIEFQNPLADPRTASASIASKAWEDAKQYQGIMQVFYGDQCAEDSENSECDTYSAASEPVDFQFDFDPQTYMGFIPDDIDTITELCKLCKAWGDEVGQDSGLIIYDGYMQSIENKAEPIMVCFSRDPRLYELDLFKKARITSTGFLFDSIERDTEGQGSFVQFLLGRVEEDNIYVSCYPYILNSDKSVTTTNMWPRRLMHFMRDPHAKHSGTYRGAWAVIDTKWKDAERKIQHFKHDSEILGENLIDSCKTGDLPIIMTGLMQIVDAKLPEGPRMRASDAFQALLYTCKINAMMGLQSKKTNEQALKALVDVQRGMEEIFTACTTKLALFMMKNEKEFEGMDGPLDELIGQGMGYTGLMYSHRFNIILCICQHLEVALSVLRDLFNSGLENLDRGEEYEVKQWNSKSTSSIYTKITDYAAKKIDPSVLSACGLTGIKDYIRTRLIVPPGGNAKKCVDHFLANFQKALSRYGGAIEDRVDKDKSFRFKPDGQAMYVTGYLVVPFAFVFEGVNEKFLGHAKLDPDSPQFEREVAWRNYGFEWKMHVCKTDGVGNDQENGKFAMPFEIQVVNDAALKFIDAMHHSYEIQRVSARISAVCPCTKDKKGDPVAQKQCTHCMYRRSQGFGYCPFCHICFNSQTQQMHCTAPCCKGKNTDEASIYNEIKSMDADKLKWKVLEMQSELMSWRQQSARA